MLFFHHALFVPRIGPEDLFCFAQARGKSAQVPDFSARDATAENS